MAEAIPATVTNVSANALAPSPVAVFQGYDSVTGRGLSTAVTEQILTVGGTSGVRYRVCEDISTLAAALEFNQSLSVGFGPFGSVDEKMQFLHKLNVTTYSISIVVYAKHTMDSETMSDVALKPGINPPVGTEALKQFFRGYGDSFLASRTRGGEYYAVYTYYSQTREEQTQLTAEMKAHGIFDGGSVDASLQTKLSTFRSSTKTRVSVDQNISGILNPKLPAADKIIDFALNFPSLPLDAPAIIDFETSGYEHVPGFGSFQPIAKNRDFFVGDGVVDGLTASLVNVQELQNQIAWILDIYNTYGGYTDTKLKNVGAQAQSDHATINGLIERYQDDPTHSFAAPALPSLDNGSPSLADFISIAPGHGGGGGNPFNDVNALTSVPQQTRVSALQLRSGVFVDNLLVSYQNTGGRWQVGHSGNGGNGGNLGNALTLLPGQFVTKASGRLGGFVDNLQLTISDGRTVGGGGGGGAFDWSVPTGSFVLGFAGRCGSFLDQIQVVYGTFQAANWR